MTEDPDSAPGRLTRRVFIAVGVALLLHFVILGALRLRRPSAEAAVASAPGTAADQPEALPQPLAVDLRRNGPGAGQKIARTMTLAGELRVGKAVAGFDPASLPKAPPLARNRLAFSAALGDGDGNRPGFDLDRLLTPLRRHPRTGAVVPLRAVAEEPADADRRAVPVDRALAAIQTRAVAEAAAQPVAMTRMAPREMLPRPPEPPLREAATPAAAAPNRDQTLPTAADGNADIARFFSTLTAQLVAANDVALAAAMKAGPRLSVEVRFMVEPDGRVDELSPTASSGSPDADAQAMAIIKSAAPLPAPPAALPARRLQLTFPVQVYR